MTPGIAILIRILEKSQFVFCFQHTTASQIDISHGNKSLVVTLFQSLQETFGTHIHVGSCLQSLSRSPLKILPHSMVEHFANAAIISHHETVVFPLVTKDIVHQPSVGRSRNTIDNVERRHERTGTGLGSRLIGRKILVVHAHAAHIHRIIVATRLHRTIEGKMLHTGHDVVNLGIVALIAAHHGFRNAATQEGILAIALRRTSPTGIHTDVHHGRISPVDAIGTGLLGSNASAPFHGFQIPAARKGQRNGEDGLIAMNHIHAYDEGNAQTTLLHRHILQLTDFVGTFQVEDTTHLSGSNFLAYIGVHGTSCYNITSHLKVQLSDFLLQGHSRHEVVDELFHGLHGLHVFLR